MEKVVPIVLPGDLEKLFSEMKAYLRSVSRFTLPEELLSKVNWIIDYYEGVGDCSLIEEDILYRARLHQVDQRHAFSPENMGAPPPDYASAGRVNPEGLPYLYGASNLQTAIAEVRPWTGALVSVGEFKTLQELRILDFTKRASVDDAEAPAVAVYSAIAESLFVHRHFSAPVHRDDQYSYLPMQFIADTVKQRGFDGIRFVSMQVKGGKNTVLFDPKKVRCLNVAVHGVGNIKYETKALPPTPAVLTVGKHQVEGKDW